MSYELVELAVANGRQDAELISGQLEEVVEIAKDLQADNDRLLAENAELRDMLARTMNLLDGGS